jgi:hypothetical protein
MRIALAIVALAYAAPAPTPSVGGLVLQPRQVGKGYAMQARADGKGVKGRVTLDLCGTDYPSEQFRTARLQVDYVKAGSAVGISNEVVTYRAGAAVQAMREAIRHATTCPHTPIDSGVKGLPKLTFRITRLHDSHLLTGYLAVRVDVSGTVKGRHIAQTSYAVYQRRGNVLSGIYSFGADTAQQRELCLHAAEQSARNLRRGTSGAGSGPTA